MKKKPYVTKFPSYQRSLWTNRQPLLSHLDMELTERCNNQCSHCYINLQANDTAARRLELTAKEIQKILEEAASLGCLIVRFTGGEPLLREDFEEIYLSARRLGLKAMIFTNGTLISPRLADLFHRIPPLEKIEISIFGMERESYEAISRVSGSFDAFQKGVKLLLDRDVPFLIKPSFLPIDAETLREFEEWTCAIPGRDLPHASVLSLYLRCRGAKDKRNELIRSLRLPPNHLLDIEARKPDEYKRGLRMFCSRFCRVPGETIFWCGAGIRKGCVDAYGKLQPCLLLRHPDTVYDLKNGTIQDALQNFFPSIRKMQATDPRYRERCARCFLKSLCEQCPAISWLENRILDGWVEYFCEFTHAQARFIGLLQAGEKSWQIADWEKRVRQMSNDESLLPVPAEKRCDWEGGYNDRNANNSAEVSMIKGASLESVYVPSQDVVAREIEGVIVIVPIVSGIGDMEDELFSLNETGRAIWKMLDGRRTLKEIVEFLAEEFESAADIRADVLGLTSELLRRRMIVEVSAG